MTRSRTWPLLIMVALLVLGGGCGSDKAAKEKKADSLEHFEGPSFTTSEEDGLIVERYTLDSDDKPDVVKYSEEYPDPDDKSLTKRRLRKKEVDVDSNGTIDIVRLYDKKGTPTKEKIDVDLDGNIDTITYFDNGDLVKKERLSDDGAKVLETRYYADGTIDRVEKDTNQDDKVDYWEYYEEGYLDRIGRDLNADERADSWTRR